jgi:hypothetical protein
MRDVRNLLPGEAGQVPGHRRSAADVVIHVVAALRVPEEHERAHQQQHAHPVLGLSRLPRVVDLVEPPVHFREEVAEGHGQLGDWVGRGGPHLPGAATAPARAAARRLRTWLRSSPSDERVTVLDQPLGCDSTWLNRTEFRIQNSVSRILHDNNLSVLSPIQDVVSIVRTRKGKLKDAHFLLNSVFWLLNSVCASTIVDRTPSTSASQPALDARAPSWL